MRIQKLTKNTLLVQVYLLFMIKLPVQIQPTRKNFYHTQYPLNIDHGIQYKKSNISQSETEDIASCHHSLTFINSRLLQDQVLLIGTGTGILVNLVSMMGRDWDLGAFQSHTWDGTGTLVTWVPNMGRDRDYNFFVPNIWDGTGIQIILLLITGSNRDHVLMWLWGQHSSL